MSGVLLEVGLTKLALSLGLGLAVLVVQRVLDRPAVAHSLWAVVLAALLLPAVVRVPVGIVTLGIGGSAAVGVAAGAGGTAGVVEGAAGGGIDGPGFSAAGVFALVWLAGTAVLLFWSLARTLRFRRLLRTASSPASPRIARIAVRVAAALGLRRVPALHTTGANLTPMVWWIGGEVHLLIPEGLAATMDDGTLEWVIAHELAHIFRRDHVVRWPEWLACVVFWWNPVAWLTRRELRAAEEFCCDELVLASMGGSARAYGGSLVAVIDYLSEPAAIRPPAFASGMDSGGSATLIERRIRRMMTKNFRPAMAAWLRFVLVVGGTGGLSLGLINCAADADALGPEPADREPRSGIESVLVPSRAVPAIRHEMLEGLDCSACHTGDRSQEAELKTRVRREMLELQAEVIAGNVSKEAVRARYVEIEERASLVQGMLVPLEPDNGVERPLREKIDTELLKRKQFELQLRESGAVSGNPSGTRMPFSVILEPSKTDAVIREMPAREYMIRKGTKPPTGR